MILIGKVYNLYRKKIFLLELIFSYIFLCFFFNVWKLGLNMKYVLIFIIVLNKIFRISVIYLYTNYYFIVWIYKLRLNLERVYYDDRNVNL